MVGQWNRDLNTANAQTKGNGLLIEFAIRRECASTGKGNWEKASNNHAADVEGIGQRKQVDRLE